MKTIASMKDFGSKKILTQFLLSLIAALGIAACATASPQPDPKVLARAQTTETFKMDGLTHNHAHVADMIASLKHKEGYPVIEGYAEKGTTILALARLGATEALPTLDLMASQSQATAERDFIFAARARLLAETEATPHARAARFFQEIGETPEQMNTVLKQTYQPATAPSSVTAATSGSYKEGPAALELADMIYHGPAAELLADPLIAQVDCSIHPLAYYKIQLALLPPDQQRQKLMDWIVKGDSSAYTWPGQILLDLGRPEAIEAITAKLREIDEYWDAYKPYGYGQLLTVLYVCGDHYQSPIWTHLAHTSHLGYIGAAFRDENQLKIGY